MASMIEPLAKSVENFKDKLGLFKDYLVKGHLIAMDDLINYYNQASDLYNESKSKQAHLEAQIDGYTAALPKPTLTALMIKTILWLIQEVAALIKLILAIMEVFKLMMEIVAFYTKNVIMRITKELAELTAAAQKYVQEQIINKAKQALLRQYEKMARKMSSALTKKKYELKISSLEKKLASLDAQYDKTDISDTGSLAAIGFERSKTRRELKSYQDLLAAAKKNDEEREAAQ